MPGKTLPFNLVPSTNTVGLAILERTPYTGANYCGDKDKWRREADW